MPSPPRLSRVELEILRLLAGRPQMYGLELVKASPAIKRGTVYVTLTRMEDKGYLTSVADKESNLPGQPRRRYSISGHGQRVLAATEAFEVAYGSFA